MWLFEEWFIDINVSFKLKTKSFKPQITSTLRLDLSLPPRSFSKEADN